MEVGSFEKSECLDRDGDYSIVDRFDMAFLVWPDGELIVGDHCHCDPTCAVVNQIGGWCVSGGQGLDIRLFEDGLPQGPDTPDPNRIKTLGLWRHENPPPDGQHFWCVVGAWLYAGDLVRVLVNPLGTEAGLYEVDVRTLSWRRL
jgi:hypothetical protein